MTQTKSTTAPVRGAYVVDTDAADGGDAFSVAVWTGRVQQGRPDGRYLLISSSGYEWTVEAGHVRAASEAERVAFVRSCRTGHTCTARCEGGAS